MSKRFDVVGLDNISKNSSGFLTYDLTAAQTGVFPYMDPETGDIVYELKHPDDLLTDQVLSQLKNLPITDEHPWQLVNPDNSKELVKGMTTDTVQIMGEKLTGRATIFDSGLIGNVLNGNKKECSLGFECEIVEESGSYKGVHYDRKQTNLKLNHLAMVEKGRCGPECSARLDSKDYAYQIRKDSDILDNKQNKRSDQTLKTIKLDGKEFEVAEEVASRIDTLKTENESLTKNIGQLEGKLDGKDDQLTNLQKKVDEMEENQPSDQKIDEAVSKRINLLKKADKFLDEDYEVEGKTDKEIKIDCIKAINEKFDGEDKADEYIDARFDVLTEMVEEGQGSYGDNNLKFKKKDSSSRNDAIEKKRQKRLNMRGDK